MVDLIGERGFKRPTVGEITERAMASRVAFYRNYRGKYHLVEQIFDEAIAALLGSMGDDGERPSIEHWAAFFEYVAEHQPLCGALFGKKGGPWFAAKKRSSLSNMVAQRLVPLPTSSGLVATLAGGMFVQAITWWPENGRPMSPYEIAVQAGRLASTLITEVDRAPG
ncbi:TetR/AcrR family transcriptional regulator [Nonomuraea sp. NPDC049625]|uniref:TetR/AcrR family transcriptional regulator n=1 Tax=Nonomuraea sp. NPDC049625 TaxID=3155775 RepID=UPI0034126D65